MDVCTIIASNYVAFARVLDESLREHHPEARCFVLVIDDHRGRIDPAAEAFEVVAPAQLEIEHFDRMAALYSVLELSTAVKPWLLRYLLGERGCEAVAYFDPDIQVFDRLDEIDEHIRRDGLVVTPHLTAPMPRDGRRPSETDILIAGSYNLGFIGLAPGAATDRLLDWWAERLETDCIVAPEKGYFVDQRWMDFAPGLVPSFHVLRDPGYNVAYWNLSARRVRQAGDRFTVDGQPLRFFHFSGFDPDRPDKLSKHQDRIDLVHEPAVGELCRRYADRLIEHGAREAKGWSYTYDRLGDGTPIDTYIRRGYRRALERGEAPEGVFDAGGARELVAWLNGPAERGGDRGVTRYLEALWQERPDVRAQYGDLDGPGGSRYVGWAQVAGRATVPIPTALVPGLGPGADMARVPFGVNVAGYFQSVVGVGEAARRVIDALGAAGVAVAPIGLTATRSPQDEALGPAAGGAPRFPVNLICVNADAFSAFAQQMGPAFFADRYSIGLWWWEVSTFPERWLGSFEHVDEVWVGSQHVADAIAPLSPVPVVRIRQPVAAPVPAALDHDALGVPDGPLFLFAFDYHSVFERKNPLGVIDAFTRAFPADSGPQLVIKSINHEYDETNHERLRTAAAERPDVHLIDRYLSREERDAITAACDCYVSLHRSEGFGFTVAEAMALGRPVIATAYSGTMEFTTRRNSFLVDYELAPIGPRAEPYPAEGEWAQPDLDHAAALMRAVVDDPQEARRRGERGAQDIAERHSLQAAGRVMAERLQRIMFRGAPRHVGSSPLLDSDHLRRRIEAGPVPTSSPRFGRPQKAAREALLRTLKPYTAYERMVDSDLVQSLEVLDRGLQAVNQAAGARMDELGRRLDEITADVRRALGFMASFGVGEPAAAGDGLELGEYPEAPAVPWSYEYVEAHRRYVTRALDDPTLINVFKRGGDLPTGYGVRFDERVVEFPWTLSRTLAGRVLDAGSTLNHPHVLLRLRPRVDELHVATLAPEPQSFPFMDVSYLYADLRGLPMRDETYDHVVCISTLEHVGMDNSQYGDPTPRAADPEHEREVAVRELRRVLRPGGTLHVTVPFGSPEDFGWQRIFDAAALERIADWFGPAEVTTEVFRYTTDGWRRATFKEAAGARYRDHFSNPEPAPDGAVAARAVACLELRRD
jgi:SAM-dependent methyltransferase